MRNLNHRNLCGFLIFLCFEGHTAPKVENLKVSLKSQATRIPNEVRGRIRGTLDHQGFVSHRLPPLQFLGLSFNSWGSKIRLAPGGSQVGTSNETVIDRHEQEWFGEVDLHVMSNKIESSSLMARLQSKMTSSNDGLFVLMGIGLILFVSVAYVAFAGESDEESTGESQPQLIKGTRETISVNDLPAALGQEEAAAGKCICGTDFVGDTTYCRKCGRPRFCPCGEPFVDDSKFCRKCGKARFEAVSQEDPIAQVEYSDGSWARAYREAMGQRRQALELLFRCNIISTQEFAYSRVSQEHIDECVWIGTYMLKQKPLEEWVALWQQAQQTFEDSVTACFTARTDAQRSSFSGPIGVSAPRSEVPLLDCRTAAAEQQALNEEDQADPYTTRSSLVLSDVDGRSPTSSFRMEAPVTCECGNTFAPDAAFCRSCGRARLQTPPASMQDLPDDRGLGAAPSVTPPAARLLSPMILRCREIMAAPPQEGVPSQNIEVLRNSSSASMSGVPVAGSSVGGGTTMQDRMIQQVRDGYLASEASISPSMPDSRPNISPSLPDISPAATPGEMSVLPSVQTLPPQDGGGALRSKPITTPPSPAPVGPPAAPSGPLLPPSSFPPQSGAMGGRSQFPTGTMEMNADNVVTIKTLAESQSEAPSAQSTAAPPSSQPSQKFASVSLPSSAMHGMPGQVKPPPSIPRGSLAPGGGDSGAGEVLVAHAPLNPKGTPPSQHRPIQLSPLLQPDRNIFAGAADRASGMSSPQSIAGSAVIDRPFTAAPQQHVWKSAPPSQEWRAAGHSDWKS